MYSAIILVMLAISAALVYTGWKKRKKTRITAGLALAAFTWGFFSILDLWGEMLWFDSLGFTARFWTAVTAQAGLALIGGLAGFGLLFVLTLSLPKDNRLPRLAACVLGGLLAGSWGLSNWEPALKYLNGVTTGVKDPIFGLDTGFYLFSLPFYDSLLSLLISLAFLAFIASILLTFVRIQDGRLEARTPDDPETMAPAAFGSLHVCAAFIFFMLAAHFFLQRYFLLYSILGVVTGPGWTDDHVRIPGYWLISILALLTGIGMFIKPVREFPARFTARFPAIARWNHLPSLGAFGLLLFLSWFVFLDIVPGVFQWLQVEPNEISLEKPYIVNNIKFTRHAFKLDEIEKREFDYSETFTPAMVEQNKKLFENIRLWDWRALDAVYKQFQEIRLYYEFSDVDIDRYTFDGEYRQVMVSARELQQKNLPDKSQTFVNKRFQYTHGIGIALNTVTDFTSQGLPRLLVKDIPPVSSYPELNVTQPRIYYGELTADHVLVNTKEKEFDYPSGENNVYTRYSGQGGVVISSLFRKFLFGWMFDGTRLFMSDYLTSESRILFRRRIKDRLTEIAPFLHFDSDPYIVLADGKLYWIMDAYTISDRYPYSEELDTAETGDFPGRPATLTKTTKDQRSLNRINYIRNSVKVVVDAYNGSVDLYVFEADDPIIRVWQKIFPGMFKSRKDMPAELVRHIRYPAFMLLVQGRVFSKYHMTDPVVFYNQEDLWVRATEKYYGAIQPVEPYYVMWQQPDSGNPEFVLILPFTPKNRQVLIGWIAGMCDGENYGRFLAYQFPKDKRVLGPQQVETKIDQDSFLSGQLTLWDQRGSRVIRGNVLAIPIENTLLYVEPVYLQAETAAYPELRLVMVMHDDQLSYADTFEKALQGLFEEKQAGLPAGGLPSIGTDRTVADLARKANQAFETYLNRLGEKRFDEASKALEDLQQTLTDLVGRADRTGPPPSGSKQENAQ